MIFSKDRSVSHKLSF